jgi:nitrite reductase/ring-hydroxylating ferredoxin subunit
MEDPNRGAQPSLPGDDTAMIWTPVLESTALAEGATEPVYPLGVNVLVARVEGRLYAVSGRCVHLGCPLLTGRLEGHTLTCPGHDWRFDVRTGRFLDAPQLGLDTYPTRVVAGQLEIGLEPEGPRP